MTADKWCVMCALFHLSLYTFAFVRGSAVVTSLHFVSLAFKCEIGGKKSDNLPGKSDLASNNAVPFVNI